MFKKEESMKKQQHPRLTGIFGGTFDPIHFGHLNLAIEMLEARHLDEIWFCPARINPLKLEKQPTPIEHRLGMLRLALQGFPQCRIMDAELKREGPSYTVDTLRQFIAEEKGKSDPRQFCLIIGNDAISGFLQWREPAEIARLVPIFVGRRSLDSFPELKENPEIYQKLLQGATATRVVEISSTDIRQRLADGLYCGHLVPSKVLDYIYAHKLYLKPSTLSH